MKERAPWLVGLASVPFLLGSMGCSRGGDAGSGGRNLNVLLISLDSTRRDLLSAYGRRPQLAPREVTSPNLDRLAAEGVLFEQASATSSWTLPSHVSLLTGVPEVVHGVDHDSRTPDPSFSTLAERLAAAGYRTAGFFSGPYLEPAFGFGRGFERYVPCYGTELSNASEALVAALHGADEDGVRDDSVASRASRAARARAELALESLAQRDRSSDRVTDQALAELELAAADERPFFLFAHYFDPHYDYAPPEVEEQRFDPAYHGGLSPANFYANPAIAAGPRDFLGTRERVLSERDLQHFVALYEGELSWTDAQVGRILARLDELGLRERTLVILVADHGEEFFEHGGIGHRRTLYEELVAVPMILRLPGKLPAGVRVSEAVSTLDVVPTVLELVGLARSPELYSRGLLPLLSGAAPEARPGPIGRLLFFGVWPHTLSDENGAREVPVRVATLVESYRKGPLKVLRQWSQARPRASLPEDFRRAIRAEFDRAHGGERLSWIDLERSPRELPDDFSGDFREPRARAALQEFHDQYARLLEQRRAASVRAPGEPSGVLEALGYGGEADDAPQGDEFVLPPPGGAVLGR